MKIVGLMIYFFVYEYFPKGIPLGKLVASIMRAQTIHLSLRRNLLNLYVILIEWLDFAVNLIVLYRIVFVYNRMFSDDSETLKTYHNPQ